MDEGSEGVADRLVDGKGHQHLVYWGTVPRRYRRALLLPYEHIIYISNTCLASGFGNSPCWVKKQERSRNLKRRFLSLPKEVQQKPMAHTLL